jgi:hypothetical protein
MHLRSYGNLEAAALHTCRAHGRPDANIWPLHPHAVDRTAPSQEEPVPFMRTELDRPNMVLLTGSDGIPTARAV